MKKLLVILIITLFGISTGYAAQNKAFIQNMKSKMKKVKVRDKFKTSSAVGGVRASEDKDKNDALYWAGKNSVTQDEYDMFSKALQTAESGDVENATAQFKQFLKKYPVSVFAVDAHRYIKDNQIAE